MRSSAEEIELLSVGSAANSICVHYISSLSPGKTYSWTSPLDIGGSRIPSSLIVLKFLLEMAPGWYMKDGVRVTSSRQVCLPQGIVRLFRMIAEKEGKLSDLVDFSRTLEHFYASKFQATETCDSEHQFKTDELEVSQSVALRSNYFNFILASMIISKSIEAISFNSKYVNVNFPDYLFWTIEYKSGTYSNGWPAHPLFLENIRIALLDIFSIDLKFYNSIKGQGFGLFDSRSLGLMTELSENRELLLSMGAVMADSARGLESELRDSSDSEHASARHILDTYRNGDESSRRVLLLDLPVGSEPLLAASIGHCSKCRGFSLGGSTAADLEEGFWTRSGFAVHGIDSQMIPRWGSVLFEA